MWQLLRGLGGRYAPAHEYEAETLENADPSTLPLDPIEVAGQANMTKMKGRLSARFAQSALSVVMSIAIFALEVRPPPLDYLPPTADKWNDHLQALANTLPIPLLQPIAKSLVLFVCTYFAVNKGKDVARAIFNGRRFSSLCRTPPPTNLTDVLTLLRTMHGLPGRLTMVEGDIRHFFHQIPLHPEVSRYFCIRKSGQQFWRWATLPMGWSWSPYIAQSVSMGCIIEVLENCGVDVRMYKDLESPPGIVEIPGLLVATVWYDNIILITNEPGLALRFHQKFRKLSDQFNREMKTWNIHHPRAFDRNSTCFPSYLGLEFAKFGRSSRLQDDTILHWRPEARGDFPERHEHTDSLRCSS